MIGNWKLGLIAALAIGWSGTALLAEEPAATQPKDQVLSGPKAESGEAPKRRFDGERPHHMRGPGEHFREILRDLNLSDEQKEKVRGILEEARTANQKYREEHKAEIESLRTQIDAAREAKDKEKLKSLHEQRKAIHEGAPYPPKKIADSIRAVLTPEQQAQFDAKLEEARKKMEERRQQWQEKQREKGDQMGAPSDGEPRKHKRDGQKPADKDKLEL